MSNLYPEVRGSLGALPYTKKHLAVPTYFWSPPKNLSLGPHHIPFLTIPQPPTMWVIQPFFLKPLGSTPAPRIPRLTFSSLHGPLHTPYLGAFWE